MVQLYRRPLSIRNCFHPGASFMARETGKTSNSVGGWQIVRVMLNHVWPKDKMGLRVRVVVALSLLIGAKVRHSILVLGFHTDHFCAVSYFCVAIKSIRNYAAISCRAQHVVITVVPIYMSLCIHVWEQCSEKMHQTVVAWPISM